VTDEALAELQMAMPSMLSTSNWKPKAPSQGDRPQ